MRISFEKWMRCAAISLFAIPAIALAAPARQRPIEEFVNAQGTYCIPPAFFPSCNVEGPIGNLLAWQKWTDGYRRFARVDFAGLVDRYLAGAGLPTWGTTYYGTITERPQDDGTAMVTVRLHTRDAPAWVSYRAWNDANGDGVGTGNELTGATYKVWGHNAAELASGLAPSLVDVEFQIVFINPEVGAPMPDLYRFFFDPQYVGKRLYLSIVARGAGELAEGAEALGLGERGDPADLMIRQVGLLDVYANLPDAADHPGGHPGIFHNSGWPVELLEVKPFKAVKPSR